MDEFLPPTSLLSVQYILQTLASVCVTCSTNYWALIGVIPMVTGFFAINRYAHKHNRHLNFEKLRENGGEMLIKNKPCKQVLKGKG